MPKQLPCCAKAKARIHWCQGDLANLARKAARASVTQRAHFQDLIAKSKADLAEARENFADHEAAHADQRVEELIYS